MEIYQPKEDSFLLSSVVKDYLSNLKNKEISCLDMGTGSAIISKNLIENGINKKNIFAVDLNDSAINQAKLLGVKTIKSDLFDNIKNSKFDLIIFNPPYLPVNEFDNNIDTTGGKKGDEIIIRFIDNISFYLSEKGVCFLLTSSLTPSSWKKRIKINNLKIKKIKVEKIFFEKLFVWKISK